MIFLEHKYYMIFTIILDTPVWYLSNKAGHKKYTLKMTYRVYSKNDAHLLFIIIGPPLTLAKKAN